MIMHYVNHLGVAPVGMRIRVLRVLTKCTQWMKIGNVTAGFDWNLEKNRQLAVQRGVSFERVVSAIERGGLVDVLEHPDQELYPGQMIYVVDIERYLHLVPFVIGTDGTRFLKTIIPAGRRREITRGGDHRERT